METQQVPVNYKGDGTWFFSAELSSGYYELEVTPHLFLYKMLLPDGKKIEGTIPTLLTKIENYHQDPELSEWLTNALSWKERESNYKAWGKSVKFSVDGKSYSMTLNPRTGDIELKFPEVIYVSHRQELGTAYPEVYGIKQGQLSELIIDIVAETKNKVDDTYPTKFTIELPARSNKVQHYDISGLEIWISYDECSELIIVHLTSRTIRTHISTIEQDVWEFRSLHDGKYREEVIGILGNNGFMDVFL